MDQSEKKIFVHLGTYNGAIIGFEGNIGSFENMYAYTPNMGSVKCVCTTGRYLLTGGFDEIIRIYDLKKKKEMGQLVGHEGTITCLRTYKNFVISGGEDGNIIIWKTKEWSLLHKLKGHKDAVYNISLHSSAKILASVGKDRKIILWNMVNGTKLFRKTLNFNAYKIEWSLDENSLFVLSDSSVHMLSQETNATIKEFKHPKRINDFILYDDYLITAGDDGVLYFWNNIQDVESESFYIGFKAHTPRVKKVDLIEYEDKNILVSCSTDGVVSLWDLTELLTGLDFVAENKLLDESLKPTYTLTTYQRIISLHVHQSSQIYGDAQENTNSKDAHSSNENNEKVEKEDEDEEEKEAKQSRKLDKKSKKIKKVSFANAEDDEEAPSKNKKQKKKMNQNNVQNNFKKDFNQQKPFKNKQKFQEKNNRQQNNGNSEKHNGKNKHKNFEKKKKHFKNQ